MIVVCAFVFGTKYWWGGFWSVVYIALALWYVPVFSLFGGTVREATWSDRAYFNAATLTCFLQTGGAAAIGTLLLLELFDDCSNSTGVCDTWHWYSTIVWLGWAFYLFVATTSAALLRVNFMHQPGDLLERAFQQHLDVSVCIKLARDGLRRDKRGAAIELGALAATGDDARQQIVDGGGVGTIVSLALSDDAATSEYAIESMAEMVSSPFCRDEFIRAGALRVLLTIAQTATPATGTAIVGALHYLIADESSRLRLAEEQAVSDLARFGLRTDFHAHTRRQLAHIYTELADCIPLRTRMAENVGTIKALAALSRGTAKGTHLLCLNALRMLAEADLSLLQKSAAIEMLLAPCSDSETAEAATKLLLRCTETELGAQSLLHAPGLALAFEGLLESAGRATHGLMAGLCRKLTVALGSEHSDARQGLIRVASFLVDAGRLDISAKRNMDRCLALLRK